MSSPDAVFSASFALWSLINPSFSPASDRMTPACSHAISLRSCSSFLKTPVARASALILYLTFFFGESRTGW